MYNVQTAYILNLVTIPSPPDFQELSLSARHMDRHGISPSCQQNDQALIFACFPSYCCSAHDYRKMNYGPAYTILSLHYT